MEKAPLSGLADLLLIKERPPFGVIGRRVAGTDDFIPKSSMDSATMEAEVSDSLPDLLKCVFDHF